MSRVWEIGDQRAPALSLSVRFVGTIAGLGLVIVGLSFFFLGGLAGLSEGPFAYANDVNFHIGTRIGGVPGFILYPVWAMLLGRTLLQHTYAMQRREACGEAP